MTYWVSRTNQSDFRNIERDFKKASCYSRKIGCNRGKIGAGHLASDDEECSYNKDQEEDYEGACGKSMLDAFQTIALTLGAIRDSMLSMTSTMERTDDAVRGVQETMKSQGVTMLELKRRVTGLEKSECVPSGRFSRSEKSCRPARAEESEEDSIPSSSSSSRRFSNPGVYVPGQSEKSVLIRVNCRIRSKPSSTFCLSSTSPHKGRKSLPRTNVVTTPPPIPDCLEERLGALGVNLLKATQNGRLRCARKLLEAGADPNFTCGSKWTPLHRAVAKAHPGIVAELLERGANIHATNVHGLTPLHIAAYHDFTGKCVDQLIQAGSNLFQADRNGRTPLHYAAESGNLVVVRALRAAGASQNAIDNKGKVPSDLTKNYLVRRLIRFCSRGEWTCADVYQIKDKGKKVDKRRSHQ